jgi:hypothetical protein
MFSLNQETWEWSPATGKWTNRTGTGPAPNARSGAAMVYDSARAKLVLFGGRAGSGSDFEDTWEWDPTTGAWTNVSAAGSYPTARSQHCMVYEKTTGKILLFGGGRSDPNSYDGSGVSVSLGDTWEYDPAAYVWKKLGPATSPSGRHDFGMVWDSSRSKAVLFAGMQTDIAGASGVLKQDTWEWDPVAATWTERTAPGNKPSQRYGHSMAFDGSRGKAVVFGGWDINTGYALSDLWEWDPVTFAWTQRLTGSEASLPSPRMYASLLSDDVGGRLELVAGAAAANSYSGTGGYYGSGGMVSVPPGRPIGVGYGTTGSREVWELNPATAAFTDRTAPLDVPLARYSQAMAFNPATGKTYLFGGYDALTGQLLNDFWAWDGKTWAQVPTDVGPSPRSDAAMAYDPARKSLILFGGYDNMSGNPYSETWEFTSTGKWEQLGPVSSPEPLMGHGMVTDTTRKKILLFGGMTLYTWWDAGPYKDPMRNDVWEWDGLTLTWTKRTPTTLTSSPTARQYPQLGYDEGRQKLFLYDGANWNGNPTAFWEWDPISAGWSLRNTADDLGYVYAIAVTFDTIRRRAVLITDPQSSSSGTQQTLEVDTKAPTWYVRTLAPSPGALYGSAMVFDSTRGVVVLFGGQSTNVYSSETWEYAVTNLGNGEGCTAAFATSCASGNCVDGVCCDVAACTGACKSCNVAGAEGTCVLAKAGTEVAGSCADGQACDGSGACKTKNGQPCAAATLCASGFCADGVCCDSACTGACTSCGLTGQVGKCSPYPAGTDPQGECGVGTGVCKSTCDGVGSCAYPQVTVPCADCYTCDGFGSCSYYDYSSCSFGGSGGWGGSGGRPVGGSGGTIPNVGGSGGRPVGGSGGTIPNVGGSGGTVPRLDGSAGSIPYVDGSAGSIPYVDGSAGSIPGRGGSAGAIPNLGGAAGSIPGLGGRDGSIPGYGGTYGLPDAGVGDAGGKPKLNHSGCGCALGARRLARSGLSAPFLVAGAALLVLRRRRRR